jgi:heme exporter protein A
MLLLVENLTRSFGARRVFGPLSFEVAPGTVFGVAGANGSGKTTLLKVLAGILRPSGGQARFFFEGEEGTPRFPRDVPDLLGWCAPDLNLYGELTAEENLLFFERVRGLSASSTHARALLESVGLPPDSHSTKVLSALSTGQRQRVKLAFATLHEPAALFLDEPSSNLDADGVEIVARIVAGQRARGLAVIASNDPRDLALTDARISL